MQRVRTWRRRDRSRVAEAARNSSATLAFSRSLRPHVAAAAGHAPGATPCSSASLVAAVESYRNAASSRLMRANNWSDTPPTGRRSGSGRDACSFMITSSVCDAIVA